jgi:hypothetical protein
MVRTSFTSFFLAGALLFGAPSASAQQSGQDAAALNPAEASCAGPGQDLGSACNSSTTTAGGTCQAGCCCRFVTDPEGASVCTPCYACSDTAYLDPDFKAGACSDGGTLVPVEDASVAPTVDSGFSAPGPSTPSSDTTSGGCSSAAVRSDATSSGVLLALGAVGWIAVLGRRRGRAKR